MKYYRITYSYEKKEVGHYPQVQKITWEGRPYDDGAFGTQGLFSSVHKNPAIPTLDFYKSAKTTSLIEMGIISDSVYLIINEPFLEFIKSYFVGTFQTWKILAKHKEINYDYYIFFLDNPKSDFINYEKSVFRLYTKGNDRKWVKLDETVKVITDEDCMEKHRQYPLIGNNKPFLEPEKIVVNGDKTNVHFLRCACSRMAGYYVSEKLKNEIEKLGFTGMRFQELNEINNFVEVEII
ncbi:hypothetical protein [Flavobacterium sp.]|uniref:hypothetical protein n=1 Tax=Flavobacterium sp. TaxID=239 RepID=UPI00286CCCAB|nr:hypothetical protein [Flavobacterium sp.]